MKNMVLGAHSNYVGLVVFSCMALFLIVWYMITVHTRRSRTIKGASTAIGELQQIQENLEESQKTLRLAMERSKLKFWQYYPEKHMSIQSEGVRKQFGTPEYMENYPKSFLTYNFLHPDDVQSFLDIHKKIDKGAKEAECEIRLKNGNTYRWEHVRYTSIYDAEGKRVKVVGMSDNLDAFKELEERFMIAMAQVGIATWTYDMRSREITENCNADRTYGANRITKNIPDSAIEAGIVHPDDKAAFLDLYGRLFKGEKSVSAIIRFKKMEEDEYWWSKISYTVVQDKNGDYIKAFGTSVDVTEQEAIKCRYEEESARRSAQEEEALATACFNITRNRLSEYVSNHLGDTEVKSNMKAAEAVACICKQIPEESDRKRIQEMGSIKALRSAYEKGERKLSIEYQRKMPTGEKRWLLTRLNMMEQPDTGDVIAFFYTYDINEQVQNREILESVFEEEIEVVSCICISTRELRYVKRENGKRVLKPLADCKVVKQTQDSDDYLQVVEEDRERFEQEYQIESVQKQLENEDVVTLYFRSLEQDREIRRKKLRIFYLATNPDTLVLVRNDITDYYEEEQRQKQELEQALRDAQQASAAKSDFLSRMSHEIRTPMNAIIGLSDIAVNETTEEHIRNYLEKIHSSGDYLLGLINDILDMSKIESEKIELYPEPFTTKECIDNIVTILRPQMQKKNIAFHFATKGLTESGIWVDKLRFQQILLNLISNSVKFCKENGTIIVVAEEIAHSETTVTGRYTLTDNGIGMSEEFLERAFEPFSQEKLESAKQYAGTGLGLAIVKNLVTLMGGTIQVSSKLGQGTKFVIELESKFATPEDFHVEKEQQKTYDFQGKRILLAEDNAINREIVKNILGKQGILVDEAVDGQEAVEQFQKKGNGYYQAILMDIRMPIMDGLEATAAIRSLSQADALVIPIIALTANAFKEDMRESMRAGMNEHLAKPIEPAQLYDILSKYL